MMRPRLGVVLGVRARDDEHVQGQPQHVAADLDVPLLHHVEQGDLDALGEVGQLVERDDAAVAAGDEAEVDRLRVAEHAALGDLHRVDVADEVRDARVRRGELLDVALLAVPPDDRQVVAELVRPADARGRDRLVGVLADLGAVDHRRPLVEQADERAQHPGLALPAFAEQHDVVAGEQRALELRDHGGPEPVDAGPGVPSLAEGGQEVVADLGADRDLPVAGGPQLADGCHVRVRHSSTLTPRGERDRPGGPARCGRRIHRQSNLAPS